ncbi:copper uptake system-associated protein [uncultured Maritimibacter sp.]|jgi:copper(I)-binding protein|uniref:copper uptake system-associated protein n=1 Tax=uncultured Maritimibacter sp. TaxID=991866 RepID=UPI000B2291F6|nr:copper uptake system-associated protein [uncultured Maritimibacter sp.]
MTRIQLSLLAVLAATTTPAFAHEFKAGNIDIQHPYAYETAPTAMSAGGYLTLVNTGETPDRLLSVEAGFDRVMLHQSSEKDGVATMTHVEAIDLPAGSTVELAPGGYHVMFMGLGGDSLEDGEKIDATLVFEQAGRVEVQFNVEARGDTGGHGGMDHGDMDHGDMDHGDMSHSTTDVSNLPDAEQIEALMKAQFDRPDAPLDVAPITIQGTEAVAGWLQDGTGGRAFLRKTDAGWMIVACAGDELLHSSTYEPFGLSHDKSVALIEAAARSEAAHSSTLTAVLNQFDGLVEIGADGHAEGHGDGHSGH